MIHFVLFFINNNDKSIVGCYKCTKNTKLKVSKITFVFRVPCSNWCFYVILPMPLKHKKKKIYGKKFSNLQKRCVIECTLR